MKRNEYRILLQAEDLLAVDKPPGIPTVGRDGLETWVKVNFPGFRPCHRLDAMTGGVVLFAKGAAYQHATALFLERRVEKRYWALTQGRVASGIYTHYLEKCAGGMVRAAKTRSPRGRTAVAEFKTRLAQGDLALVRCLPHTGRTHQLRVQLSALGHPILGDDRYGNREFNRAYGARYQALWADTLILPDWNGRPIALHSRPYFPHKALQKLGIEPDFFDHPVDGDGIGE
ncbi:RNA pseudouridine synthase [Christensenella sp. MSJ-20]|uniref:RluA family pseudouridine synthase n=1 Tax=Christensenella sp. MSJ-20 TaxID=2841518 RepID=UPI001C750B65|nr:RNA pseudouridine synthase [Christensenella sp. MSJ-20]